MSASRLSLLRRFASALARPLLLGDLRAGAAGFREADGDRLLTALHALAGAPALQRAALALVHRALDLLPRLLAVLGHAYPPYRERLHACSMPKPRSAASGRAGRVAAFVVTNRPG